MIFHHFEAFFEINAISEDAGSVLEHYNCPCSDAMDPACDCFDTADAFLTDYTWYCNQRYALTEGFSAANSRTYPIYSTLLRQPRPRNNDDIAFHGIGEYLYFGTYRKDNGLTEEQENWMKMYQNYISNFIRTGNPNDWTDNPNEEPAETFIWENFVGTERWNELGINKFSSYGVDDDQRKNRCGMLDDIQHYMLH